MVGVTFPQFSGHLVKPRQKGRLKRRTAITGAIDSGTSPLDAKDCGGYTKITTTALYVESIKNRSVLANHTKRHVNHNLPHEDAA